MAAVRKKGKSAWIDHAPSVREVAAGAKGLRFPGFARGDLDVWQRMAGQ